MFVDEDVKPSFWKKHCPFNQDDVLDHDTWRSDQDYNVRHQTAACGLIHRPDSIDLSDFTAFFKINLDTGSDVTLS